MAHWQETALATMLPVTRRIALTSTLPLCFLFMLTLGCSLLQQLMPFTKCVVATGGGAVLRRKNWGFMQHAVVIWLDGSPELLASHVVGQTGGTKSRPLIFSSADVKQQEQVSMLCPAMSPVFLSMFSLLRLNHEGIRAPHNLHSMYSLRS